MSATELTAAHISATAPPVATENAEHAGTYPSRAPRPSQQPTGQDTVTQHAQAYQAPERHDPRCATGCGTAVRHWGQVCSGCVEAFGDYLQPSAAPALDYEAIVARDSYVAAAYAAQQRIRAESEATP
jgi:hypothetical protein